MMKKRISKLMLTTICLSILSVIGLTSTSIAQSHRIFVATDGNDANPGTKEQPLATLHKAKQMVRDISNEKPVEILVREGTYYLGEPLIFRAEDSGSETSPVIYKSYEDELVTISGGQKLDCNWESYKDGIMMCRLPDLKKQGIKFTQLFINGVRGNLARYPNYDNSEPGKTGYVLPEGKIPDDKVIPELDENIDMTQNDEPPRGIVYSPENFTDKKWDNPDKAIIHIFQGKHWGNLQWTLKEVDYKNHYIWFGIGGHQIGAKWNSNPIDLDETSQFYIENIFEELDAPNEWYWDENEGVLYYKPAGDTNMKTALVEIDVMQRPIQFLGTQYNPVRNITLDGFRISHTSSTFMEQYWIPSGSDWSIHRGGTVFMEGSRDCSIINCWFDAVGGNAVFMNNYNRGNLVTGCKFTEAGESAICLVGSLEFTNGTHKAFPYECKAVNNLIRDCGIYGKQVAGVYISRAKRITVSHNLIYNLPRAGICIGDGTWGGHLIEFNHVHHVIRETWDHGPFNSWGREGYWCLTHSHGEGSYEGAHPAGKVKVWAMETTTIRNNYWHGNVGYEGGYRQGIDMDDGSSDFHVYNNVCRDMALSIREGAYRTVENNIIINPVVPIGVHLGHPDNHDIIRRNIIITDGPVYYMNDTQRDYKLLQEINFNSFYHPSPGWGMRTIITRKPRGSGTETYSLNQWQNMGYDSLSIVLNDDPLVDLENNNFKVKDDSKALETGFKNFDMNWGITPEFPKKWLD